MQIGNDKTAHIKSIPNAQKIGGCAIAHSSTRDRAIIVPHKLSLDAAYSRNDALGCSQAIACENTISISVPECVPVLMWNCARLASTSALVSDRLTPELSEA